VRPVSRFAHLMSSFALVAPRIGTDTGGYGRPVYGPDVRYQAHLSRNPELLRTGVGQEAVSRQSLHLATADPIQVTARVTLSTADVGSTESTLIHPPILSVERLFDQKGPHHTVLRLT
jgi:hypothetical protein